MEEIKLLRKEKGWTQKQMSEFLNMPTITYVQWENNKRKPPKYVIELIKFKILNDNYQLKIEV